MSIDFQLADAEHGLVDDVINLNDYPLDRPQSARWLEIVAATRAQLASDGCHVLPSFLTSEATARARAEIAELAPKAAIRTTRSSVYVRSDTEVDLSDDDPRGISLERTVAHLTRDQIPPDSVVARIYVAPAFKAFITACVGAERIFEYADPLAGLIANIVPVGGVLPWHYDTCEFVVSLMTQAPDSGGEFMYCPDLRRPGEENLDGLGRVLRGEATDLIRTLQLRPGDVQIFKGRYSLHQVALVTGGQDRHVAVFGYADRPGVIGPLDRTRAVYGRVTEAHLLAHEYGALGSDGLIF